MKLNLNIDKDQFTIRPEPEDEYDVFCISAIHEAKRHSTTKIIIDTISCKKETNPGDPAGL